MILQTVRDFYRGYLELRFQGTKPRFFLNQAAKKGVRLWDIRSDKVGNFYLKVANRDFAKLRPLVRQGRCSLRIFAKCGWPPLRRKIYHRRFFGIGLILFCAFLWYLSSLVLWVKIEGAEPKRHPEILRVLETLGIKRGVSKSKILTGKRELELQSIMQLPDLVWLGIRVDGSVVVVKAIPRRQADSPELPGSLIASEAGVIEKITVFRGIPVVNEGQTVDNGEMLIEGARRLVNPDTEEIEESLLPAAGIVEARVWREIEVWEPYEIWESVNKGKQRTTYRLRIGSKMWTFWGSRKLPSGNYFWERGYKRFKCGRNSFDNVEFIKDIYHEAKWHRVQRKTDAVREIALREAQRIQRELGYIKPKSTEITYLDEAGFCRLTMVLEFVRDIAIFDSERKEPK